MSFCGNTTNLRDHLVRRHLTKYDNGNTSKKQKEATPSVTAYFGKKVDPKSIRAKEITGLIVDVVTQDIRPVVDRAALKNLIVNLAPGYEMPCQRISKFITLDHKRAKEKLRQDLSQECNSMSITTDVWTSMAQEEFLTVTCHYIKQNWALACRQFSNKKLIC
ncbi:UNVERIFIED_CONTAM: hypothetical protein FKN15_045581 [Acipenser sinensis]